VKLARWTTLIGPAMKIRSIAPPGPSYADWKRFLDECEAAGLVAVVDDAGKATAAEPFGMALLRRWRWLHDSIAAGLEYEQAEAAWVAGMEREQAAMAESMRVSDRNRAAAIREREGEKRDKRRARAADGYQRDPLDYAKTVGL